MLVAARNNLRTDLLSQRRFSDHRHVHYFAALGPSGLEIEVVTNVDATSSSADLLSAATSIEIVDSVFV